MKKISKKYIILIVIAMTFGAYHYSIKSKNDKIVKIDHKKKQLIYYNLFLAKLKRIKATVSQSSSEENRNVTTSETTSDKKLMTLYGKNLPELDDTIKKIEGMISQLRRETLGDNFIL